MTERKINMPPEALAEFQNACLLDDKYMVAFFKDNIPAVQYVLRIIMDKKDLIVHSVKVQYVLRGPKDTHSVRLDVYAVDSEGRQYDIEVQNEPEGASPQRAAYNMAMLTINTLKPDEAYSLLTKRERAVIFITRTDVLKGGLPLYKVRNVILETQESFNDGALIIYVNTSHKDSSTELGKLIHDFRSRTTNGMYSDELRDISRRVRKEDEAMKTWDAMEKAVEARTREEIMKTWDKMEKVFQAEGEAKGRAEARKDIAINLIKESAFSLEKIAGICKIDLQQIHELAAALKP